MSHLMTNPNDTGLFGEKSRLNELANRERNVQLRDEEDTSIRVEKSKTSDMPTYMSNHSKMVGSTARMVENANHEYLKSLYRVIPTVIGSESEIYTGGMRDNVKGYVVPFVP